MNELLIEKQEFTKVYGQNNPSFFTGGGETVEKNYKILPVSENEKFVQIVTDGSLKTIQKDYPSARESKDYEPITPRSFNGNIRDAVKWLESNTAEKKPEEKKPETK